MTTTADPRGRMQELCSASQTALATAAAAPGQTFQRRAFYDWRPAPQSEPQEDQVLGAGFHNTVDETPAAPDLERGGLGVDWPLDMIQAGYALFEVFGAPATTGDGPYVHTFTSATVQLPTRTFERKLASGQFDGAVGAVARSIRFPVGADRGYTRVSVEYLTRELLEQYADSIAGEAAALALSARVPRALGQIALDGSALGSVLSGSVTVTNLLGEDAYHGSRFIDDVQLEGRQVALDLTVRFKGAAARDLGKLAVGAYLPAAHDLVLTWELSASSKLVLTIRNLRFAKTAPGTNGPGRLDVPLRARGEVGAADPMITAVLTNGQAAYA